MKTVYAFTKDSLRGYAEIESDMYRKVVTLQKLATISADFGDFREAEVIIVFFPLLLSFFFSFLIFFCSYLRRYMHKC
jgi:hypothetical protein